MVEFKNPDDAMKAVKLSGLQLGGKRLVIKPRTVQQPKKEVKKKPPVLQAEMEVGGESRTERERELAELGVVISEERLRAIPEVSVGS